MHRYLNNSVSWCYDFVQPFSLKSRVWTSAGSGSFHFKSVCSALNCLWLVRAVERPEQRCMPATRSVYLPDYHLCYLHLGTMRRSGFLRAGRLKTSRVFWKRLQSFSSVNDEETITHTSLWNSFWVNFEKETVITGMNPKPLSRLRCFLVVFFGLK